MCKHILSSYNKLRTVDALPVEELDILLDITHSMEEECHRRQEEELQLGNRKRSDRPMQIKY